MKILAYYIHKRALKKERSFYIMNQTITKKEAKEEYLNIIKSSKIDDLEKSTSPKFKNFVDEIFLHWYKTRVKKKHV